LKDDCFRVNSGRKRLRRRSAASCQQQSLQKKYCSEKSHCLANFTALPINPCLRQARCMEDEGVQRRLAAIVIADVVGYLGDAMHPASVSG